MWTLSSAAAIALAGSHRIDIRVSAYTAALGTITDLPVSSGEVTVDATSQTRRSATVGFADNRYWPTSPLSILSPLGSELAIEYGVVLSSGTVWIPLIRGPITDVTRTQPTRGGGAAFEAKISDRSLRVAEARFDQPTQTVVGATAVAEIRRLITEVLPTVTVTDLTGSTQVAAQLTIERERWADGIEKLADSIAAEVFADPQGNVTIRPQPVLTAIPVWTVAVGDGGNLLSIDEQATRDFAYSKVVASGQRTDGTAPVWAAVSDTNPASPTYINGPFGTKTRFYASPLLTTTLQCTTAATALLERTKGMSGRVSLSTVVNPALDAGDVILVRLPDGSATSHIIDTVTIPLSAGDEQRITTRTLDLPSEYG